MSFSDLKKNSRLGSLTSKLTNEIEKMNKGSTGGADERLWKLDVDKAGNGYAVIRFLPAPNGEELPWAKVWSHAFQGPGGWYIENSLTTLGGKDPVSEYNRILWNSGADEDKEQARKQKRKLTYIANIYVVKDPANPQNEGKVFLYKFGKKIFDKIRLVTGTMISLSLTALILCWKMMTHWKQSGRSSIRWKSSPSRTNSSPMMNLRSV